ncbi:MAG: Lrp/AsnC family transcriptional regulator [Bacteroidia bacterium]|nr:Lrp/AsnC family transcriptional regulator [Bacteroidia bacterium]
MEKHPELPVPDAIDRELLRQLQRDARQTHKQLAAQLGLTVTPVYERVRRLERQGWIQRYTAICDRHKLNRGLMVFCFVSISPHKADLLRDFEAKVSAMPEVTGCYHLTGEFDYLLKVLVADVEAYRHFMVNRMATLGPLSRVQSSIVMAEIKDTASVPIP